MSNPLFKLLLPLLFSLVLLGCEFPTRTKPGLQNTPAPKDSLATTVITERTLEDSLSAIVGLTKKAISYTEDSSTITVWVPDGKPLEILTAKASQLLQYSGYTLLDAFHNTKKERTRLTLLKPNSSDTLFVRIRRKAGFYPNIGAIELVVRNIDQIDASTRIKFLTANYPLNYLIPSWIDNRDTTISILGRYGGHVILQIPLEDKIHRLTKKTDHTIYVDDHFKMMQKKLKLVLPQDSPIVGVASYGGALVLNSSTATKNFARTLYLHKTRFYDMRESVDNIAYTNCEKEGVPYERIRYSLSSITAEDLKEELAYFALKATKRYRVTVWADATPELIKALNLSTDYFDSLGITLKAIQPIE